MMPRRAPARPILAAALLAGVLVAGVALAQPGGQPAGSGRAAIPPYVGYVNDVGQVMPEDRRAQLESFLDQLHTKTQAQFAVLTVPSCAPEDPSAYKVRVFQAWGIGDRERKDGVLLLVAMQERKLVFETGYGLEGTLPDGWESRMLRDLAVPKFREGKPDEGIIAAVLAASQRIAAEKHVTLEWNGQELHYDEKGGDSGHTPFWLPFLFFMLFFVILPAVLRSRRRGGWYSAGGWGGGFGGWGGGWGGGGGGGGGGGFGGFGGGSSGGGGGGAGW